MYKKTRIVATVGPVTSSKENLEKILKAGVNVIRLNFSHGTFEEHQEKVDNFRYILKKTGLSGAIMQDLSGPKIRLGDFYQDKVELKKGNNIIVTTKIIVGDENKVSINYPMFPREVKKGDRVMIDDGKKVFEVLEINGDEVLCKIIVGGITKCRRGVNLPDSDISVASLTEKDKKDLEFGLKNKVDFFAFSFIRKPEDVTELREILNKRKSKAKIIAKIETPQAVKNIDAILELCDGLMVARGDLAVEVPAEKVPLIQKMIVSKCNDAGKIVIVATQMLESMIKAPVPTRAEVSDVANAILDGADAVMLSEETTLGEYPVEAVSVMSRVSTEIEAHYPNKILNLNHKERNITDAITESVVETAKDLKAKAIVALTESGYTARMISRFKPKIPIVVLTPDQTTFNQLSLTFGCTPVMFNRSENFSDIAKFAKNFILKNKIANKGDKILIASGIPFGKKNGFTNMLAVEVI
jgi:pyruvate kinase